MNPGSDKDVEELKAVLSTVSEFLEGLPKLLKEVLAALYSKDIGESAGASVAAFHKQLSESGLSKEDVRELTMKFYEDNLAISKILREVLQEGIKRIPTEVKVKGGETPGVSVEVKAEEEETEE